MIRNLKESMLYRPLGRTGIDVSCISIGTLRFEAGDSAIRAIHAGMRAGINFIETCPEYGESETITGNPAIF